MNTSIKTLLSLCVVLSLTTLTACESVKTASINTKDTYVKPAPDAGFIENPERQINRANLPFQKSWIKPGFVMADYSEIVVAPVNTNYMQEMSWLHKLSSANWTRDVKKDTESLAVYFRKQVEKEFRLDPNKRFRVIDIPQQHQSGQKALRLELALIEIEPSIPVLHALGWAAPYGTGTAAGVINQRRAAFEGRLRDVQTNEVVATFADRDTQDAGPLDVTRLTWYGPAKGIMDRWAQQFVQIANRKLGEAVRDPVPFTLRPF
jgi:hypothetical protein